MWIFIVLMMLSIAYSGYLQAKRKGMWTWARFFGSIAFIVSQGLLISLPLIAINLTSPWFWPACLASWSLVIALFILFIFKARKWKTSATTAEVDPSQA